jgi:hypothetical protein
MVVKLRIASAIVAVGAMGAMASIGHAQGMGASASVNVQAPAANTAAVHNLIQKVKGAVAHAQSMAPGLPSGVSAPSIPCFDALMSMAGAPDLTNIPGIGSI